MCNMIEFAYNLMLNLKSKMHYQPEFPYKYEESTLVKFTPKSYENNSRYFPGTQKTRVWH